jgi:hypothetical protein
MRHIEYHNNAVLAINHNHHLNKLVLLKARLEGSVYVAVIDTNDGSSITFDIKNVSLSYRAYYAGPLATDDVATRNKASRVIKTLTSNYVADFILIDTIYIFDVEYTSGQILIDASCIKYELDDLGTRSHGGQEKLRFIVDMKGDILYTQKYSDWRYWGEGNETRFIKFLDSKTVIVGGCGGGDGDKLIFWNLSDDKQTEKDLLQWDRDLEVGSIYYQYIGSYALSKEAKFLCIEFKNPAYGQDCIKVFQINAGYNLTEVFKYVFQDCHLTFMAFAPEANEFAILEYTDANIDSLSNVNIRIYGTDETHIPRKIVPTKLNHHNEFIREIIYYSTEVLSIITTDKIFLYDVVSGVEIDVLTKDAKRPYSVSVGKIYYILNGLLAIYTIENGALCYPKPKVAAVSQVYKKTAEPLPEILPQQTEISLRQRIIGIARLILIIIILIVILRSCWAVMNHVPNY